MFDKILFMELRELLRRLDRQIQAQQFDFEVVWKQLMEFISERDHFSDQAVADLVEAIGKDQVQKERESWHRARQVETHEAAPAPSSRTAATLLAERIQPWIEEIRSQSGVTRRFQSPVEIWESLEKKVPNSHRELFSQLEKQIYSSDEKTAWSVLAFPGRISYLNDVYPKISQMAAWTGFEKWELVKYILTLRRPEHLPRWRVNKVVNTFAVPGEQMRKVSRWEVQVHTTRPTCKDFEQVRKAISGGRPKEYQLSKSRELVVAAVDAFIKEHGKEPCSNMEWERVRDLLSREYGKHYARINGVKYHWVEFKKVHAKS